MEKFLACACVCLLGISAEAANKKNQSSQTSVCQPSEAYDADLFRRDEQVFSLHGEFLFWRVQEGALDYALKMKQPAWGPTASYAQGDFKTTTYNGDPGFRIMASFFRAPKYWEVWGAYTRLTARGKDEVGKPTPDQEFLTGTWPHVMTNPLAGAKSWIHMNYNTADLLVDRFFNPNPHLRLRLLGGGMVVWMDQDWKIHYNDSVGNLTKIRSRWSYVGGGFRVGTMVDWFWGYDIYITALTTAGLTLGSYENRTEQTTNFQPDPADNTAIPIRNAKYCDIRPAFTIQAQFGPSWQKSFTCTRWEVFAGYELNTWLNLHEVYRSTSGTPSQDKQTWINTSAIALQGLTTRLTVDF